MTITSLDKWLKPPTSNEWNTLRTWRTKLLMKSGSNQHFFVSLPREKMEINGSGYTRKTYGWPKRSSDAMRGSPVAISTASVIRCSSPFTTIITPIAAAARSSSTKSTCCCSRRVPTPADASSKATGARAPSPPGSRPYACITVTNSIP